MSSQSYEHVLSPPGCFTAEEMQFLAEDVPTHIVSNFSTEKDKPIRLIQGDVPGFVAAFSRYVPLWLCLSLKRQGKCRVNVDQDALTWNFVDSKVSARMLRREKINKLPSRVDFYFTEVSELIFRDAREDFDDWHDAQDTLLQLAAVRQQKLRTWLKHMYNGHQNLRDEATRQSNAETVLLFNYYSASELNLVRRFVHRAARGFHALRGGS